MFASASCTVLCVGEDYDPESGGKWDVRSLKLYLISKFGVERVNKCFMDIQVGNGM